MSPLDLAGFEASTGRRLRGRREYIEALGHALRSDASFASGKLGGSERAWLAYPPLAASEKGSRLRAYEVALAHRSLFHAGVWPGDPGSLLNFSEQFSADVGELDAIGLFPDALDAEREIVERLRPRGMLMAFELQEPVLDPRTPRADCWLEQLRGRRLLIVSPFAKLLRERAQRETYEAAWASVGKRWFEPAHVEALEIPYGYDPATRARWPSSLDLADEIAERMDAVDYECALIGAGGLGIHLAVHAKRAGRAGLSLGGSLQLIFGVGGARWRRQRAWREGVINDAWVDVPADRRPDPSWTGEDHW